MRSATWGSDESCATSDLTIRNQKRPTYRLVFFPFMQFPHDGVRPPISHRLPTSERYQMSARCSYIY